MRNLALIILGLDTTRPRWAGSCPQTHSSSILMWVILESWNKYDYVRNNPLRYVDPNGETATVSTNCTTTNNQTTCNVNISASITVYSANDSKCLERVVSTGWSHIQRFYPGQCIGRKQSGRGHEQRRPERPWVRRPASLDGPVSGVTCGRTLSRGPWLSSLE
jgi:hypothetical protein